MQEEKQEKKNMRAIDDELGTGKFVNWEDGNTKTVVITGWYQYDKDTQDGVKLCIYADVLKVDDKEYAIGEKCIDTTSINFQKEIKKFLLGKNNKSALHLKVTRKGDKQKTQYFIEEVVPEKTTKEDVAVAVKDKEAKKEVAVETNKVSNPGATRTITDESII